MHIATTFVLWVIIYSRAGVSRIESGLINLVLNVLLIQEWLPIEHDINGVAWYLGASLFLYFLFPFLLKLIESNHSKKRAIFDIVLSVLIMLVIAFLGYYSNIIFINAENFGISLPYLKLWLVHFLPISRICDFVIGLNLGYLYIENEKMNLTNKAYTLLELLSVMFVICVAKNVKKTVDRQKNFCYNSKASYGTEEAEAGRRFDYRTGRQQSRN